jgi:hypothetical protein
MAGTAGVKIQRNIYEEGEKSHNLYIHSLSALIRDEKTNTFYP